MTATDPAKQLAKEIAGLRREVSGLSRGSQMSRRSIEGGGIPVYDDLGNHRGTIGILPDGTTGFQTLNGPPPPQPSGPILFPEAGGLEVTWDGTFWEDAAPPGDFHRLEVHASPYAVYTPDETTYRAAFISAGTMSLSLPPEPWTVCFVAVSTSEQRSVPSVSGTETPVRLPSYEEVVSANGKNKVFWRDEDNPPDLVDDELRDGDLWFIRDPLTDSYRATKYVADTDTWAEATLGDEAIGGLNVGKLIAGEIGVGQRIIAGPQFGTHAEMSDTGFRVFREDPVDGIPDEVARMGTETNDYFAIVGQDGVLKASIDDTGQGNFSSLNVTGEAVIQGLPLTDWIENQAQGVEGYFTGVPANDLGPIVPTVGVAEVNAVLDPDRLYEVSWRFTWKSTVDLAEARCQTFYTAGADGSEDAPPVLVTSTEIQTARVYSKGGKAGDYITASGTLLFRPAVHSRHRFLIGLDRGGFAPTGELWIIGNRVVEASIRDVGLPTVTTGQFSQGGGSYYQGPPPPPPPPPTQQYDTGEMSPAGWATFRGDGSQRFDVPGPVQGYDPSGYNGDGGGFWWWNLPNITGTVNRVDVYLYSEHWYYNSGGTAILNMIPGGVGADFGSRKLMGDWHVGGYPKPGGKWITLPGDWADRFRNAWGGNRATGFSVGRSGGSNLAFYGRFNGGAARLRIWYTQ